MDTPTNINMSFFAQSLSEYLNHNCDGLGFENN